MFIDNFMKRQIDNSELAGRISVHDVLAKYIIPATGRYFMISMPLTAQFIFLFHSFQNSGRAAHIRSIICN